MTTAEIRSYEEIGGCAPTASFACVGDERARLLGGPSGTSRPESLASHRRRLGALKGKTVDAAALQTTLEAAAIVGRGGGEFALARKIAAVDRSRGVPLVVVNASEGEPASRKDITLLRLRPHLVLDGAVAVARAIEAAEVVIYSHATRTKLNREIAAAIAERAPESGPKISVATPPHRYVAGESSAVVSFLERGVALPRRTAHPAAVAGVAGRSTIVSNTETFAHVALLVLRGTKWYRGAGSEVSTGSTLLTLAGDVRHPGLVVESLGSGSFGDLLSRYGGLARPPRAVLLGGYGGSWVDGSILWRAPVDRYLMRTAGASIGCGVVAAINGQRCGLAETARIFQWMSAQSAGQCGPCVTGLPEIHGLLQYLIAGRARSRDVKKLHRLTAELRGRGACGHPTAAVELVESALHLFTDELAHHLDGERCIAEGVGFSLGDEEQFELTSLEPVR